MSDTTDQLSTQEQEYFDSRGESGLSVEEFEIPDNSNEIRDHEEQGGEETRRTRTVPHGALHAEREEHKKTRAELQSLREEAAQMKAALEAVSGQFQSKTDGENNEISPPDPREDFLGFTRWQVSEINRLKAEMAAEKNREAAQKQAEEVENALWNEWNRSIEGSRKEIPDITEALNFLAETRDRQLSALGKVDVRFQNSNARAQQMRAELRDIIAASLHDGGDPAKNIYEIARGLGFGTQGGERFKGLDAAQTAARTLAASTGRDAGDPMLMETVANLSEAEFAKWYEQNRDQFRKMFGG